MQEVILRMQNIRKTFPGVVALDNVNLDVRSGTVHSLMGENGAGKSTLMKCLIGMYTPDEGTVELAGDIVRFKDTKDGLEHGISMIHQELSPVPEMMVAENIWLGRAADWGCSAPPPCSARPASSSTSGRSTSTRGPG